MLSVPFLIEVAVFGLALVLFPEMKPVPGAPVTTAYVGFMSVVMCIWAALRFGLISLWSDHIGAGPFVGAMRTDVRWVWIALITGPIILIFPTLIAEWLMQGQDNWVYSNDYDPAWNAPENLTLAKLAFVLVLAPLVEEVTFRGVGMGAMLARGVNPVAASVLASAAFAFVHLQYSPAAIAVVFVASLGFSALRLASGTIIVPILAHMAANITVVALTY